MRPRPGCFTNEVERPSDTMALSMTFQKSLLLKDFQCRSRTDVYPYYFSCRHRRRFEWGRYSTKLLREMFCSTLETTILRLNQWIVGFLGYLTYILFSQTRMPSHPEKIVDSASDHRSLHFKTFRYPTLFSITAQVCVRPNLICCDLWTRSTKVQVTHQFWGSFEFESCLVFAARCTTLCSIFPKVVGILGIWFCRKPH